MLLKLGGVVVAGTNLFHIDEDGIRRTLAEANGPLERRRNAILERRRMLTRSSPVSDLNDVLVQLRNLQKEAKRAKASDGRGFNRAVKVVKDFFDELLQPIDEGINSITREAERQRSNEDQMRAPIVATSDGEIICEASTSKGSFEALTEVWEISSFDKNIIDLNLLKDFFSDYQINLALKKHLDSKGPNSLHGVHYERKLKPR